MNSNVVISKRQLERYPMYLKFLIFIKKNGVVNISSSIIAREMKCSEEQVRKDFQAISKNAGKCHLGRNVDEMIRDLKDFLGYNKTAEAVLIGVGNLGKALLHYSGFASYGLKILAAFDVKEDIVGTNINGTPVYDISDLKDQIALLNVKTAILVTPASAAQETVDLLVQSGITAIWNFVSIHLQVPDNIIIENVDLAASLAKLTYQHNKIC